MKTGIATADYEPDRSDQLRQAIIHVLAARFGAIPPAIVERISQMEGNARLNVLVEHAVAVDTLDEFGQHANLT